VTKPEKQVYTRLVVAVSEAIGAFAEMNSIPLHRETAPYVRS
jgi:hypothetical protein